MEKRALIAFALSLLVLVFWEFYFGLYRTVETPAPTQESATTTIGPSTSPPQATPGVPVLPFAPQALPKDLLTSLDQKFQSWFVDAPLYKTQILAPGARINSFQLKKFRLAVEPESPPMEMVPTKATGYLPLAVDFLGHQDWQLSNLLFTSDAPAKLNLELGQPPQTVSYQAEVEGQIRLTKVFTFMPDSYVMDMEIRIDNISQQPLTDQIGVSFYFQPYVTQGGEESSYNVSQLSHYEKGTGTILDWDDLQKKEIVLKAPIDWAGYENNYFIQAIMPVEESGYQIIPRILDEKTRFLQVVYLTDPFLLPGGQSKSIKMRLYVGSKELNQLDKAGHNLSKAVDYGWFTFLAKPLLHVLNWVYGYVRNYGVAIILLTIFIKLIFWPLTQKSYESMQKMKKIQPKIAQVREKYKNDREKLNQELMGLYKTYKVNPMGGCLPMVLQIPVFFALYRMLNGAVELRHEPFIWWINDLTAPDRLNIGIPIPYLGGLPILTLLMGASMFIQQKMTPTGGDPRQEQIMLLMPVVFTVFFINFPSGLVLYWLVNNVLSIAQQYWINRRAA